MAVGDDFVSFLSHGSIERHFEVLLSDQPATVALVAELIEHPRTPELAARIAASSIPRVVEGRLNRNEWGQELLHAVCRSEPTRMLATALLRGGLPVVDFQNASAARRLGGREVGLAFAGALVAGAAADPLVRYAAADTTIGLVKLETHLLRPTPHVHRFADEHGADLVRLAETEAGDNLAARLDEIGVATTMRARLDALDEFDDRDCRVDAIGRACIMAAAQVCVQTAVLITTAHAVGRPGVFTPHDDDVITLLTPGRLAQRIEELATNPTPHDPPPADTLAALVQRLERSAAPNHIMGALGSSAITAAFQHGLGATEHGRTFATTLLESDAGRAFASGFSRNGSASMAARSMWTLPVDQTLAGGANRSGLDAGFLTDLASGAYAHYAIQHNTTLAPVPLPDLGSSDAICALVERLVGSGAVAGYLDEDAAPVGEFVDTAGFATFAERLGSSADAQCLLAQLVADNGPKDPAFGHAEAVARSTPGLELAAQLACREPGRSAVHRLATNPVFDPLVAAMRQSVDLAGLQSHVEARADGAGVTADREWPAIAAACAATAAVLLGPALIGTWIVQAAALVSIATAVAHVATAVT